MKIIWTEPAQQHLLNLDAYLYERNPDAADRVANRILQAVETLDHFPLAGKLGRVDGARELVVPATNYIVVYRIRDGAIGILAVMHGAQRWPRQFAER